MTVGSIVQLTSQEHEILQKAWLRSVTPVNDPRDAEIERLRSDLAAKEAALHSARRDAERWRWIRHYTAATSCAGGYVFSLPTALTGVQQTNLLKGSVAGHLNVTIDRALASEQKRNGESGR